MVVVLQDHNLAAWRGFLQISVATLTCRACLTGQLCSSILPCVSSHVLQEWSVSQSDTCQSMIARETMITLQLCFSKTHRAHVELTVRQRILPTGASYLRSSGSISSRTRFPASSAFMADHLTAWFPRTSDTLLTQTP